MHKDDFSDIRALLALKRNELPSDDYFRTVLPEFHRRQRAELLQPKSPWVVWWNDLTETVSSFVHVSTAMRYAALTAAVAVLCALGVMEMRPAASPDVAQTAPRAELYAFNQSLDSRYLSKIDQIIDAASVGSLNSGKSLPHYVLAEAPASYDATMAF